MKKNKVQRVSKQTKVVKEKNTNLRGPTFSLKLRPRTTKETQQSFPLEVKEPNDHLEKKATFKTEPKRWLDGSKAYHKFALGILESKIAISKQDNSRTESKEDEDCLQEAIYKKKKVIKKHEAMNDPTYHEYTEEFEIKKIINQTDAINKSETIIQNHIDQIRSKVFLLDYVLNSTLFIEIGSIMRETSSIKFSKLIKETDTANKFAFEKINISETSNNSEKFILENAINYKGMEEDSRIYQGQAEQCASNSAIIQERNEGCIQSEGNFIIPNKKRPGHYLQGDKPLRITKMSYDKEYSDLVFTIEWKRSQQDCEILPSRIRRLEMIKYDPLLLLYFYEKHLIFSNSFCLKENS